MRRFSAALLACVLSVSLSGALFFGSALPADAASTGANAAHTAKIVSENPASNTPNVMDGEVLTIAKVGAMIVVGGTFTTVRNAGNATNISRRNLFAFNPTTGAISGTFRPQPNGTVFKVLPAADGSVYVGGNFTQITSAGKATAVGRLTKLSVATGTQVTAFKPGTFNAAVRDLEVTGGRLWVAGKFSQVQGKTQRALGTINATTGAYDGFFTGAFSGVHRPELTSSITSVLGISTDRSNGQLIAVGNFTKVNGLVRSQITRFGITGTKYTLAPWYTKLFESACSKSSEAYVYDVNFSPNGQFFAVATTGAYGGLAASTTSTSGCDVVARFEGGVTGVRTPTWTAYTGGDTTWTVEVTDNVVYAGGHQKFQNNPTGNNIAGQGAVARPGIAALNAVNGLPYSWNPTRTRGIGIKDMLATDDGLYVVSDTDTFAGETHNKVAFLPLAGGKTFPSQPALKLPGEVFRVASGQAGLTRSTLSATSVTAGPTPVPVGDGPDWRGVVGAFMLNGKLYTAYRTGAFTKRDFDGAEYGNESPVDTADALVRQTDWHNGDVPALTSLFYTGGRIYFTRTGQNVLYSRGFEPESDVVGQLRVSSAAVSGVTYSSMRGAFVADGKLYFASTSGVLSSATWSGTAPVAGTAKAISGAGGGWASQALFAFHGTDLAPVNQAPTARATVTCEQLVCSFDATASSDPEGDIDSYGWEFGDGENGEGATTNHTYAEAGARSVTLTVTDEDGLSASTTVSISPY